ncbi:MAG: hypothetical protein WCP69_15685 [Bacteroidota bacterium]
MNFILAKCLILDDFFPLQVLKFTDNLGYQCPLPKEDILKIKVLNDDFLSPLGVTIAVVTGARQKIIF